HHARVVDRLERAAGAGRERRAPVAPELERDAGDVVPLLGKQCRRHGRVHSAAHRGQHLEPGHERAAGAAPAPRAARAPSASAATTASTSAGVVVRPIESRSAQIATARGTPIAVSTGEGSTAPLAHAAPAEAATPRASRAISRWSLRAPGTERLSVLGS